MAVDITGECGKVEIIRLLKNSYSDLKNILQANETYLLPETAYEPSVWDSYIKGIE